MSKLKYLPSRLPNISALDIYENASVSKVNILGQAVEFPNLPLGPISKFLLISFPDIIAA